MLCMAVLFLIALPVTFIVVSILFYIMYRFDLFSDLGLSPHADKEKDDGGS